jgi:hypothetical protein
MSRSHAVETLQKLSTLVATKEVLGVVMSYSTARASRTQSIFTQSLTTQKSIQKPGGQRPPKEHRIILQKYACIQNSPQKKQKMITHRALVPFTLGSLTFILIQQHVYEVTVSTTV